MLEKTLLSAHSTRLRQVAYACLIILLWFFAAMAVISGHYEYSVIPYADAWQGYLGFYNRLTTEDWSLWWSQHNEHRIIVARILFWLDLHFLQGKTPALVILNYLFSLCFGLLFWKISKRIFVDFSRLTIISFLLVPCLSLVQMQNFYLQFQGQFILAYLIPLISFYMLTIYATQPEQQRWFYGACLAGIISVGTMANGLLALPVLALLSAILKLDRGKILTLSSLSVLAFLLYFQSYQHAPEKDSFLSALFSNPTEFISFLLLYLGSPLHYVFQTDHRPAIAAGAIVIATSVIFLTRAFRCKEPSYFEWTLLAFLAFIGGGALASASGRLSFGLEQAVVSRYCTPVIWAWTALALLSFSPKLGFPQYRKTLAAAFVLIFLLLFSYQVEVISRGKPEQRHFAMRAATLALQLQIIDSEVFKNISLDSPARLLKNAKEAGSLSAFTLDEFSKAKAYVGRKAYVNGVLPECSAAVNAFYTLDTDKSFNRIEGWALDATTGTPPSNIIAINSSGEVVGYAIVGKVRKDIANLLGETGLHSGFFGYMKSDADPKTTRLIGLKPDCLIASDWSAPFTKNSLSSITSNTIREIECPASIDSLSTTNATLRIEGWVAGNVSEGGSPDELVLHIKSENTNMNLPLPLTARPDVNFYFGKSDMGPVGFALSINLPTADRLYELSFIRNYRNQWEKCRNISRTLLLDKASGT